LANANAESVYYVTFGDNLKNYVTTLDQAIEELEASFGSVAR
jgi:hypothetical protein